MFLQTSITNRRKFLERSALGAGSVLFAPLLLESCTDHLITPGNPTITPPLVGDYEVDWSEAAKTAVVAGIGMIPEVGEIIGPLVDIFWPKSQVDVWSQVRAQTEALIDQKIADNIYNTAKGNLDGLKNVTVLYLNAVKNNGDAASFWVSLRSDFSQYQPNFQESGYELLLLPLFGQFVNMYLSTLRDAVTHGSDLGIKPGDVQDAAQDLTQNIKDFTKYVNDTYSAGRAALQQKTQFDYKKVEPFRTVNNFDRQMTLTVLDFRDAWPYFDVTQYPNGAQVVLTREIYSDPIGEGSNPDLHFAIVTPGPTQPPTQVDVWSTRYFDAIQMTYPPNSGPGGVTQTPKYGSNLASYQRTYAIQSNNPITVVEVTVETVVNTVLFTYLDNSKSDVLGTQTGGGYYLFDYENEIVSSAKIGGVPNNIAAADFIVFGFMYWQPPAATLNAIRNLYVKSPKEHSVADYAKAFPKLAIPADLITDELKTARQEYWTYIAALAKGPK